MAHAISYPHPVLGNEDDVRVGAIAPEVSFRVADELVEVTVSGLTTTNPTLDEYIATGAALWAVRVQCARTYYRRDFTTSANVCLLPFQGPDLDGRVEIEISLFARHALPRYKPTGLHEDYGDAMFDLESGEVIGIGPTFSFDIDKHFDPLRAPVASIMRINKGEHEDGPFTVAYDDDLVLVYLSHADWAHYAAVKDRLPSLPHVGIVLPALVGAIQALGENAGRRWADRLHAIMDAKNIDDSNPLIAAQLLLQQPLTRALDELNAHLDREHAR